jgi:hypothetical protein
MTLLRLTISPPATIFVAECSIGAAGPHHALPIESSQKGSGAKRNARHIADLKPRSAICELQLEIGPGTKGLLGYIVQCSRREFLSFIAQHRDNRGLLRVFEMPDWSSQAVAPRKYSLAGGRNRKYAKAANTRM